VRRFLAIALALGAPLLTVASAQAVTTSDVDNGGDASGQACLAAANDCSLRSAIEKANATANSGGSDVINIPAALTVQPTSVLPTISEAVTIDGNPGSSGPAAEVDGSGASLGPGDHGLTVGAGATGTVIQDIALWGFPSTFQILLLVDAQVRSSYIGLEDDGTTVPSSSGDSGIAVSSSHATIGGAAAGDGNVIAGQSRGINFTGSSTGDVDGNLIGLNKNGASPVGTGNGVGIFLNNTPGVTIGAQAANVVSGNAVAGVQSSGSSSGSTIVGNLIGTNPAGATSVPNGIGILLEAGGGDQVGGPGSGEGNLISGNSGNGITLDDSASPSATVQGNRIGSNQANTGTLQNGGFGIEVSADGSTIGGAGAGEGNTIIGNAQEGIRIDNGASDVAVDGNYVGIRSSGTAAGNAGAGINVVDGSGLAVGGAAPNHIAGNGGAGIRLALPGNVNGYDFGRNAIFNNSGIGIDLGTAGADANSGFPDSDDLQDRPVLTSAVNTGSGTSVTGTLASAASTHYRLDYYRTPGCDLAFDHEGQVPVASVSRISDSLGEVSVDATLSPVSAGDSISVTATRTDSPLRTSEFSPCRQVTGFPSGGGGGGGGGSGGAGGGGGTTQSSPIAKPVAGKSVNIEPVSGKVVYKCKGDRKRRLEDAKHVPVGCLVDARKGKVRLLAAANRSGSKTKSAVFYDGQFTVREKRSAKPITEVRLAGKLSCKTVRSGRAVSESRRKRRRGRGRRLWGKGKGRFRTRGRHSSATVRGTTWLVQDRCDGTTLTKVRAGRVRVSDFFRHKTVTVKAGHTYVAKRRR
jgi:hypothetical protein